MNVVFVIWIRHIRITTRYRCKLIFVRLITAILLSAHFRKVSVNRTFILNVSIRMMSSGPSVWRNHQSFSKCAFYQSLWEGGIHDLLQDVKILEDKPTQASSEILVYCYCKQPEDERHMIACDNPACTIEWYHMDCLKIKTIPKGKWFSPTCRVLPEFKIKKKKGN